MGLVDRALDASILFSFDRSGFLRHAARYGAGDLDVDLAGRVALVTGANSGLGLATARGLLARGARVAFACRDRGRGAAAIAALPAAWRRRARLFELDVASLADVDRAARGWRGALDVLVHNAGVLPARRELTDDGLERTFATHVAGPLRLTHALRGALRRAAAARVILVSSGGMYAAQLSLDDLDWARRPYDGVAAYAQTKRMQVVLAGLLAPRLAGAAVVHAMHPGWADTPAVRSSIPRFWERMRGRLRDAEQGADTILWLAIAAAPGRDSGGFWFDRRRVAEHLLPWTRENAAQREAFWSAACAAAGVPAVWS
ncbi:MAG: SDR family NAD(P)-dependent oxidoreductase [Vicinamibacteria bacterium]|nr:SDR family NAD(P)-dependent oxidoreductase [Vicinamibacteria bacterium]